jgi:hypothetical protein
MQTQSTSTYTCVVLCVCTSHLGWCVRHSNWRTEGCVAEGGGLCSAQERQFDMPHLWAWLSRSSWCVRGIDLNVSCCCCMLFAIRSFTWNSKSDRSRPIDSFVEKLSNAVIEGETTRSTCAMTGLCPWECVAWIRRVDASGRIDWLGWDGRAVRATVRTKKLRLEMGDCGASDG